MSNVMDQIIEDLVKGASRNTRANGGPGVNIIVSRENRGREEKLAAEMSTLAGGIPGLGAPLSALSAASNTGSMGSGILTGMGSMLGQGAGAVGGGMLGGLAGRGLGGLAGNPELGALLGTLLGGGGGMVGGGMLGAAGGRALGHSEKGAMFGAAGGMLDPSVAAARMVHGMGSPVPGGAAPAPAPAAHAAMPAPPQLPRAALDRMHASSPFAAPPKMAAQFNAGVKAALTAFGIKEGFAAAIPGLLAAGRAILPMASKALANPIGQQVAGTAASMGVQKLMTPKQPQAPQQPQMPG